MGVARTVVAGPAATGAGGSEAGEAATEVTGAGAGATDSGAAGVGMVVAIIGAASGCVRQEPFGIRETGRSIW